MRLARKIQKYEWHRQLIRLWSEWEGNIKMGLQEFGFDSIVQDMDRRAQCVAHSAVPSVAVQGGQLLGDCQLLYCMRCDSSRPTPSFFKLILPPPTFMQADGSLPWLPDRRHLTLS